MLATSMEEVVQNNQEILSVFPTKNDSVVLTTGKSEIMTFNFSDRQLKDLDEFEDPLMKHQFEEIMNEGKSIIYSEDHPNLEPKCEYVFMDSNQNYILIKGSSLFVYYQNGEMKVLNESLPPSKKY